MMASTTTSIGILLLAASIHAFNIAPQSSRTRPRTGMPPLHYTDIDPEISAITIDPSIRINGTSIFVQSSTIKTKPVIEKKPKARKSHKVTWQLHYNELKDYKAQHGNVLIPQSYKANPKLGLWVMQQRRQWTLQQNGKKSSLDGAGGIKRVQLLEDIGFVWRVQRRGPRNAYGSLEQRMHHQDQKKGTGDGILDAVNFETFMVEKTEKFECTDDDIRAAWLKRFEIFQ